MMKYLDFQSSIMKGWLLMEKDEWRGDNTSLQDNHKDEQDERERARRL